MKLMHSTQTRVQPYRHSPTYEVVKFPKTRCQSKSAQVGTVYAYGQLHMYIKGSQLKSQLQHRAT